MKRMLDYFKPYYGRMAIGLSIKFIGTIMDLFLPWILAHMIDDIVPQNDVRLIIFWGVMMLLCAAAALITNIVANRMASLVARNTTEQIRHDLYKRTMYMSARTTDEFTIPSLISRLTSDTYNMHQMTGMIQRLGVRAPILLIGGICFTLMLDPALAVVMIAVLPLLAAVLISVSKRGVTLYTKQQQATDELVRTVRENFSGIRVIKALSKTAYEKERFSGVNEDLVNKEKKAGITMAVTSPAMNLLLNFSLTIVILIGAYRVNAGYSQPGTIIAFTSYFTIILNSMMMISRMFTILSKGTASARRIADALNSTDDLLLEAHEKTDMDAHINFEDVSFSYSGATANLHNISFSLKRGQSLGIIGKTGSGKSTLISLLLRFYDPDSGVIRINGHDIRSIPDEVIRSMYGVVFQNGFLMAGTIAENIDFGRDIGFDDIQAAAVTAQAMEFISALDDGFSHPLVTKGANFSGGQKQRIQIARALAGKPEVLILDDSSSALDYKTDAALRNAIGNELSGVTTIIVAQRVSSISASDLIMVLDGGSIIGLGTHDELIATCQTYREIDEIQRGEALIK